MDRPLLTAIDDLGDTVVGGIAFAIVILATVIVKVGRRTRREIATGQREIAAGQREIAADLAELLERTARIEGLLDGLRDAVSGRRDA